MLLGAGGVALALTRDDVGNGACETIFVRNFEVLRRGPGWPRGLQWLGALLLAAGILAWIAAPHRPRR